MSIQDFNLLNGHFLLRFSLIFYLAFISTDPSFPGDPE